MIDISQDALLRIRRSRPRVLRNICSIWSVRCEFCFGLTKKHTTPTPNCRGYGSARQSHNETRCLTVFSDDCMHAYLSASLDANGKMSFRDMSVPGPQTSYLPHQANGGSSFGRSDKLTDRFWSTSSQCLGEKHYNPLHTR